MLVSEQHTEGTSCKSCYKEKFCDPQQQKREAVLTLPSYMLFSFPSTLSQRNSSRMRVYLMVQQPMAELTLGSGSHHTPPKQMKVGQTGLSALCLQFKAQHCLEGPKANPPSPAQNTWTHLTENLPTRKMTHSSSTHLPRVHAAHFLSHPDSPRVPACSRDSVCCARPFKLLE